MSDGSPLDLDDLEDTLDALGERGRPMVKQMAKKKIRKAAASVFEDNGPQTIRGYIAVDYDMVQNELPDEVEAIISRVGPRFSDEIQKYVTADNVLRWLKNPGWLPVASDVDQAHIEECGEAIENEPGGREWLEKELSHLRSLAGAGGSPAGTDK